MDLQHNIFAQIKALGEHNKYYVPISTHSKSHTEWICKYYNDIW